MAESTSWLYISVHIRAHADSPLSRTRDVHETSRPYSDGWTLHSILYLGHVESSRKQEPVQRACIPNNHSAITLSRAKHLRIQHCISARVGPNSTKEILGRLLRVSGQEMTIRIRENVKGGHLKGKRAMTARPTVLKGGHVNQWSCGRRRCNRAVWGVKGGKIRASRRPTRTLFHDRLFPAQGRDRTLSTSRLCRSKAGT
jgi:hypothetical protein